MDETERLACLLPVESLVSGHGRVTLQADDAARFLSGLRRRGEWADADEIAVFGSQPVAFLGTAHARARELIPGRLLNPIEIQQILLNAPVNATSCETTP
jgi:tRNA pseudouridine55 synthase